MGAYVTRTDPKTGSDRKYYKADDGKLYQDYNAAATAFRESRIRDVMGVNANIIDPNREASAVRSIAPAISDEWGNHSYANPVTKTIGINDYKPGSDPYLEAHEAGHLSNEQAGPAKFLGVSGRAINSLSDRLGNPAPLDLVGGIMQRTFDASEEDRAERLSAKYGQQLGGDPSKAPEIDSEGRSRYGNNLRKAGDERATRAIAPIVDPIKSAIGWVGDQFQKPGRANTEDALRTEVARYRQLSQGDVTPELTQSSQRIDQLRTEYNNQGGDFDSFIGTIN